MQMYLHQHTEQKQELKDVTSNKWHAPFKEVAYSSS
jgi:hypothetical protein